MKRLKSQSVAWSQLLSAYDSGTFPQSLLIEGSAGIGKKAFGLALARRLICEETQGDSHCGQCPSCRTWHPEEGSPYISWVLPCKIIKGSSESQTLSRLNKELESKRAQLLATPFSLEIFQLTDQIYIEQIRQLQIQASYARAQRQVIFLPEADRLGVQAANALLKILEEAPSNLYFILTTSNRSSLLPTILSRCSRIFLPPNEMSEILELMNQDHEFTLDPQVLIHLSDFSIGKCLQLMETNPSHLRQLALEYLERMVSEGPGRFQLWLKDTKELSADKDAAVDLLDALEMLWSDFLSIKLAKPFRNQDIENELRSHPIMRQTEAYFFENFDYFAEARRHIKGNSNVMMTLIATGLQLKGRLL